MTKIIIIIFTTVFMLLGFYGANLNTKRFITNLKSDNPKKGYEWYIVVAMTLVCASLLVFIKGLSVLNFLDGI